jgi:hypothetical protein
MRKGGYNERIIQIRLQHDAIILYLVSKIYNHSDIVCDIIKTIKETT